MAAIDVDLRNYLLADSAIIRQVGTRIYENHVPQNINTVPFIYFVRTGDETFDAINDPAGTTPNKYQFAVECIGRNISESRGLADLVKTHHKEVKTTFGSRTASVVWIENQSDDYVARAGAGDSGFHTSALQMEVFV